MLDGVSLDQLRTFLAAADAGSFSAGARQLRRAQSAVSQPLSNLEAQVGVKLSDRAVRSPALPRARVALRAEAGAVVGGMDVFKARAKGLSDGLEPELCAVVDVVFPLERLTTAVAAFQEEFPAVPLRLYVEALGAVLQPVIDGRCALGVMGSLPTAPAELTREHLLNIGWAFVASPTHPLASIKGAIPARVLAQHRQLVLTDRSELSQGKEFGVFSANTWRLADLGAKHAFLRAGLGWGPLLLLRHEVERTAEAGRVTRSEQMLRRGRAWLARAAHFPRYRQVGFDDAVARFRMAVAAADGGRGCGKERFDLIHSVCPFERLKAQSSSADSVRRTRLLQRPRPH